ncbi:type I-E CRISPR-associated protein Cse1/CasA [Leucobacter insecticola]|uniref:Type I-E CRISPR-associated protein Cse1/CasA n=1 Tax=Leucobacter insecticola TaxID=2714934 RepID=A0A6G8FHB5_9MICO|nr:type I-E CRISPR-associated protein Cse1/CasA [Leucobacter insecticola]QIM15755.1 type I-E CRISPR-associated protein Cse1/CasA [Leucobacter insecticola]
MSETTENLEALVPFNLVDEPWVPTVGLDGVERDVSLREVFRSAHELRDVAAELPTMRFAILRVIFAIMYRVLDRMDVEDPEAEWAELWNADTLPSAEFDAYLTKWHDRFNLFDAAHPFMQTPGLRTAKDEWKPIELIVADTDPERALFTMRSELNSLSFAEAARWLIHTNAYDFSGIKSGAVGDSRVKGGKGYPSGIGFAGWLGGITLRGNTLRETLLLNLIRGRAAEQSRDVPIWEQPPLGPSERSVAEIGTVGPLALLTWPQRRMRLRAEQGRVTGVLVTNGDPIDYTVQSGTELYTAWRFSEPQSQKAKVARYMPQQLETGRALWQGLTTLLPTPESAAPREQVQKKWNVKSLAQPAAVVTWLGSLTKRGFIEPGRVIEIMSVSMEYGAQQSSYSAIAADQLAITSALTDLSEQGLIAVAHDAVRKAQAAIRALTDLVRDLNRAVGGETPDVGLTPSEDAYASLDIRFRSWLLQLKPGCDAQSLLQDWVENVRGDMRARAAQLVEAAPPAAWAGRKASAGVTGDRVYSVATAMRSFEFNLIRALGRPAHAGSTSNGDATDTQSTVLSTAEEADQK